MRRPGKSPPKKKDPRAEARARFAKLPKLSERMLQFAKPLLDELPEPPTIDELRQIMVIVTVAWNVPVYEQSRSPQAASYRATFDVMMRRVPPQVANIISAMLDSRRTTYADDPRLGFAEVVEGAEGQATIVATAALTHG